MIIISFSGIDGSGKSTLKGKIKKKFQNKKINVIHLFSENVSPHSKINEGLISKFLKKFIQINQKSKLKNLKLIIGILSFLIESWIFYFQIKRSKFDIVILDRYYYDYLVNFIVKMKYNSYYTKLSKLFPKCNISFTLYVEPQISYQRKKERNLEELEYLNKTFFKLSNELNIKIINTNKDIEEYLNEIISDIKKIINNEKNYQ